MLISVCICTYKRQRMLADCLLSILKQKFNERIEVILVDNDIEQSAKKNYEDFLDYTIKMGIKNITIQYFVETQIGIPYARNTAVVHSNGDFIAFLDDDEIASEDWLFNFLKIFYAKKHIDVIWGPVIPIFNHDFSSCIQKSYRVRRQKTGEIKRNLPLNTGNVILRRNALMLRSPVFNINLANIGGSDSDFFTYLQKAGCNFYWQDEAIVFEIQNSERNNKKWHYSRSYRLGWSFSHIKRLKYGYLGGFIYILLFISVSIIPKLFLYILKGESIFSVNLYLFSTLGKLGYYFGIKLKKYY